MNYIMPIIVGFTIVVSMVQNGRLSKDIGIRNCTLMNFITGLFGASLIFLITKESLLVFKDFREIPLLGYIGGILGVLVVLIGTLVVRKISVIASTMLAYTGQLLAGIIIDLVRGTELSFGKIAGCLLIVAGVYINTKIDEKKLKLAT